MTRNKFIQTMISALLVASFLFGGSTSAGAQGQDPPPPLDNHGKISITDRLAAAERAKAGGLVPQSLLLAGLPLRCL